MCISINIFCYIYNHLIYSDHSVEKGIDLKETSQKLKIRHDAQTKMHETEIDIDIDLVKQLLTGQFPALAERPINLVQSTGTVNAIFRIGDDLCARLPRMGSWAESLVKEYTWLPKLAPYISLAIPRPFAKGNGTNYFPYPWAIYHWIDGFPYCEELINDELQLAQDLADFILELRSIDIAGAPHGGRDPLPELDEVTRIAIESSNGVIDSGGSFSCMEGIT